MLALLLGGIRLHALQLSTAANAAVSASQSQAKRQSFDTDASYCIAPPRIFAFEPAPAAFFCVVQGQSFFVPAHPDGWYFNRPPPTL